MKYFFSFYEITSDFAAMEEVSAWLASVKALCGPFFGDLAGTQSSESVDQARGCGLQVKCTVCKGGKKRCFPFKT